MFKFIKSQNEKDRVTKEYIENIEKKKSYVYNISIDKCIKRNR